MGWICPSSNHSCNFFDCAPSRSRQNWLLNELQCGFLRSGLKPQIPFFYVLLSPDPTPTPSPWRPPSPAAVQ